MGDQSVRVWEQVVEIPTYGVGKPNKNPMFLEKRVYQGSSGKVYPYPVIDKIEDDKKLEKYQLVILENEYVRIEIMPELGGRIYRALDKTNQYDFVYYNRVIKPALVGLAGPWISGGIEFNWPQHHRPNTFGPVEYRLEEAEDGSATVWIGEIDRMYGTKVTCGFRLYPGKAYLEVDVRLYNRTSQPQTFLWWANPAVAVNDNTQSVFPPDVTAVFDHGKRDVSRFPIATGTYYKMDYSEGVDISRYKNIQVPTSYMAYKSDYDFVGGYDHGVRAGILHVASHHVSPGKKQWTWGCGEFGKAWDRNLTDEDGPYIELMTGVFTDNQPDFSWLQPHEEKSFRQYFMPYKNIGVVKNASIDAAVNLEVDIPSRKAAVQVYATSPFVYSRVELKGQTRVYLNETTTLSPNQTFNAVVSLDEADQEHDLTVSVYSEDGRRLIAYRPKRPEIERVPDAAKPLQEPKQLQTIEQLYLAGLHLEQYRHATFEPEAYYLEGLKRDPSDIRINVAYGRLLLRRGLWNESEAHFRTAIQSLTWRNPNPYDGEAYYQLGLSLKWQGRPEEAYAALYKATWSEAWKGSGYFALAQLACGRHSYEEALEFAEQSLVHRSRNYQSRNLRAAVLRKVGRWNEAIAAANETLALNPMEFGAQFELQAACEAAGRTDEAAEARRRFLQLTRGDVHNHLALAADYADCGLDAEAAEVLQAIVGEDGSGVYPMLHYALGYLYGRLGDEAASATHLEAGRTAPPDYCFPYSLFELAVLEYSLQCNSRDAQAHYLLGVLLYDKKRHEDAIRHWEISQAHDAGFPTVHRNLALAYYNKRRQPDKALDALQEAFRLNEADARVFYELDQLLKKRNRRPEERLTDMRKRLELIEERDDLYLEYVTLLNLLGQQEEAIERLARRKFHPWEGGEGKATSQYVLAHAEVGRRHLAAHRYEEAAAMLNKALHYPDNLGEGKLAGAQENNIYYLLGCVYEGMGDAEKASRCFETASIGLEEPTSAMFYNDQPPDMIYYQGLAWLKRGNVKEAKRRFNRLVDYAELHLYDDVKIDYFAISLPDFLVFEDDLNKRNIVHCRYMLALGYSGLKEQDKAKEQFQEVLRLDANHQGAIMHFGVCRERE